MALFWFLAGVLVGSSVLIIRRHEEPPAYQPSQVEHEIARLLEPDELNIAAYLYKGEGLVGYHVEEGRPS
jgi:hypothetical protein